MKQRWVGVGRADLRPEGHDVGTKGLVDGFSTSWERLALYFYNKSSLCCAITMFRE